MEFYLIAIIVFVILLAVVIDRTLRMKKMTEHVKTLEEKVSSFQSNQEEFSLNLSRLNAEADREVPRDSLTQLTGKQAFEEHFRKLVNQSGKFNKSFALIMLNIDDFEKINKEFGYEFGDAALVEISSRLKQSIRQVDTITRYAGDVFLVLLPNLAMPETAVYAAQRLLDSIVLPIHVKDREIIVTAGIGITIYPHDGNDMETLIKNAEIALRISKKTGKNLYQFYQQEIHMLGKREIELKSCIKSKEFLNALAMNYEFYINTLTHEKIFMEAIPLMNHKDFGVISFSEFARISEYSGKTLELYEWMFRNSIMQFNNLKNRVENHPKQLILSFTLKQIENLDFVKKIILIVKELNMNPTELIFEVKDDMDSANAEAMKKSFDTLNEMGIQIAIGILGLGHFALQKIKNLPINYLKIDNKLIKDIDTHIESKNILERILFLTNSMKINVLTEGVEKEEQKNILESLGCYVMQGDIFKKDMQNDVKASVE